MVRIIFNPPVVEPALPPIKSKTKTSIFDITGQLLKSSVLKPVVVKSETAVKMECRRVKKLI